MKTGHGRDVGGLAGTTGPAVVEHVRAGVETRLGALLAHEAGTRSGADPEELHQMRVSVRRIRAMLKSGRPLLDAAWSKPVLDELGWLGRALGPVRDLDVMLGRLREDAEDFGEDERADLDRLVSELESERTAARRVMLAALDSDRYAQLVTSLSEAVRHPLPSSPSASDGHAELDALVTSQFRKLRKAVERAGTDGSDGELHALRILGKRLRYTAELAETTSSDRYRPVVRAAKRFQDVLGEHQDACVAEERVRRLLTDLGDQADAGVGFVAGRLVEREIARRAHYRQLWWACWLELRESAGGE